MKTLTEQLKEAITHEFVNNSSKGESYCIYKAAMNCELIATTYFNKELNDMQDAINKVKDICLDYLPKEKIEQLKLIK